MFPITGNTVFSLKKLFFTRAFSCGSLSSFEKQVSPHALLAALRVLTPLRESPRVSSIPCFFHTRARFEQPLHPFPEVALDFRRAAAHTGQNGRVRPDPRRSKTLFSLRSTPRRTLAEPQPRSVFPPRGWHTSCSARPLPRGRASRCSDGRRPRPTPLGSS